MLETTFAAVSAEQLRVACGDDPGWVCRTMLDWTGNGAVQERVGGLRAATLLQLDHAESVIAALAEELAAADPDVIDAPEVWGVERLGAHGISIRLWHRAHDLVPADRNP